MNKDYLKMLRKTYTIPKTAVIISCNLMGVKVPQPIPKEYEHNYVPDFKGLRKKATEEATERYNKLVVRNIAMRAFA